MDQKTWGYLSRCHVLISERKSESESKDMEAEVWSTLWEKPSVEEKQHSVCSLGPERLSHADTKVTLKSPMVQGFN